MSDQGDHSNAKGTEPPDRYRDVIRKGLIALRDAFAQETVETKEMFDIYLRFTQGKASKEELKRAEDQLQDVMRTLGLTFFSILPFAPVTIPAIVKLGEKFGIEVLPSAFRKKKDGDKPQ